MQSAYDVSLYRKMFWHNYQLAVPVKPSPTIKNQPSADVFRRRGLLVYERGGFDGYYKITLLSNSALEGVGIEVFCYPIKLHYSQTSNLKKRHYSPYDLTGL